MSGRADMDAKNEKWIEEHLRNCDPLVVDYMSSIDGKKTSVTRKQYLFYINEYCDYLKRIKINIVDVKPMHIERFRNTLSKKGNGHACINAKLSAIISFYKFLVKNDLVQKNPCDNDMKLKVEQSDHVVYMTDEDVQKVKNSIISKAHRSTNRFINRDLCIIQLGCSTGLRVSAICNIDIDDIDFKNKTITVIEKGNKKRVICIGNNTINIIRKWMIERLRVVKDVDEKALFIGNSGNRMSTNTVRRLLDNEAGELGKRITPHKMRSTCAMKLYEETGDIYLTAQQLGHANIKNTMIYAKATEEKQRMAADILD